MTTKTSDGGHTRAATANRIRRRVSIGSEDILAAKRLLEDALEEARELDHCKRYLFMHKDDNTLFACCIHGAMQLAVEHSRNRHMTVVPYGARWIAVSYLLDHLHWMGEVLEPGLHDEDGLLMDWNDRDRVGKDEVLKALNAAASRATREAFELLEDGDEERRREKR